MKEKIEWYREVLEIEPNSKVFFPLARLLVKAHQTEDALKVLEKGLERHPEFLEARLMLIELLHKAGKKDVCDQQIQELSKMFASYAGFWEAWAACLAAEPGEEDTASIIRYLATGFIAGPLHLHEVLNRGLDAILKDKRNHQNSGSSDSPEKSGHSDHGTETDPSHAESGEVSSAVAGQPVPEASGDAAPENPVAEAAMPEDIAVENDVPQTSAAETGLTPQESLKEDNMAATADMPNPEVEQEAPVQESSVAPVMEAIAMPEQQPESTTLPTVEEDVEPVRVKAQPAVDYDDETVAEPFSLRTKSMAEVLADQGDIKGAMDIYMELAASSQNQQELDEINARIDALKEKSGKTQEPAPQVDADKEKLIGVLEALASRVEARVHN